MNRCIPSTTRASRCAPVSPHLTCVPATLRARVSPPRPSAPATLVGRGPASIPRSSGGVRPAVRPARQRRPPPALTPRHTPCDGRRHRPAHLLSLPSAAFTRADAAQTRSSHPRRHRRRRRSDGAPQPRRLCGCARAAAQRIELLPHPRHRGASRENGDRPSARSVRRDRRHPQPSMAAAGVAACRLNLSTLN